MLDLLMTASLRDTPGLGWLEVDEAVLAVAHVRGLGATAHLLKAAPVAAVAHRHYHRLGAVLQPAPEGADARLQAGRQRRYRLCSVGAPRAAATLN